MKTSNPFIAFLKVLRPVNLVVIAALMYMLRYFIFQRWIDFDGSLYLSGYMDLQLSHLDFGLLVFSVVCIAAAGYIINDYFDMRADRINKPERVIIGRLVKRRIAMVTHFFLNCVGVLLGFYVAWKAGNLSLGFFNVFAATMLWFYSIHLKRQYLIGNLTIAILAAIVPIMVGKYEIPLLVQEYGPIVQETLDAMAASLVYQEFVYFFPDHFAFFNFIMWWAIAYAAFAFMTTLIREIVKDLADYKGDLAVGCKTIPIVMGIPFTKGMVVVLTLVVLASLGWVKHNFIEGEYATMFFALLIGGPLIGAAFVTISAKTRKRFLFASNLIKVAMVTAILYTYFAFPHA